MWDAALAGSAQDALIVGYDVAQTDPNLKKVHAALKSLDFLIVQDLFSARQPNWRISSSPGPHFWKRTDFTNLRTTIQRIRKRWSRRRRAAGLAGGFTKCPRGWVCDAVFPSLGHHG